ncbi:MAG: allantoicase [Candidatus Acidiferrales bacterium]
MKDFTKLVDLASERLGGKVLEANDEFFASKENLLKESKPIFIEGKYTPHGKWMDGWETRRRRTPGHDWCVIRLGLAGIVRGVVVDTSHFKGNFPSHFSLEACDLGPSTSHKNEKKRLDSAATQWIELAPQMALQGDTQNLFSIEHTGRLTHLRLKIYPDGGVARLRVYGEVVSDPTRISRGELDLVAIENGGRVVASSDEFFSAPLNLLMPGRGKDMSDGWETRRRRGPGHDWVILKLGIPGVIKRIEVDTAHFKGNYPDRCALGACYVEGAAAGDVALGSAAWRLVLPEKKLKANHRHIFRPQPDDKAASTHVRFKIYPDGGVSRLRLFGRAEPARENRNGIERFNQLAVAQARKSLVDCCGSKKWVDQVIAHRPFTSAAHLIVVTEKAWGALDPKDWLEAFGHHPAIGTKRAKAKQSTTARQWSAGEQSAAQKSSADTLAGLKEANQAYHAKFGHVFLICATGKTSEEILKHLHQRLTNDSETELRNAAEEQRKITRLRLEKLLES